MPGEAGPAVQGQREPRLPGRRDQDLGVVPAGSACSATVQYLLNSCCVQGLWGNLSE